jgi:hypothetical protein
MSGTKRAIEPVAERKTVVENDMKRRNLLLDALLAGLVIAPVGLLAQDGPKHDRKHMRMHQGQGEGHGQGREGRMQGHQEIADAVTKVRENLTKLQAENDLDKIKAALAENQALLEEVEGTMAARRTQMQLRMMQSQPTEDGDAK